MEGLIYDSVFCILAIDQPFLSSDMVILRGLNASPHIMPNPGRDCDSLVFLPVIWPQKLDCTSIGIYLNLFDYIIFFSRISFG